MVYFSKLVASEVEDFQGVVATGHGLETADVSYLVVRDEEAKEFVETL